MFEKSFVIKIIFILNFLFCVKMFAQTPTTTPSTLAKTQAASGATVAPPPPTSLAGPDSIEEVDEGGGTNIKLLNGLPNKRRIRRHLSLIDGVKHDEELLIPDVPLSYKGAIGIADIQRIKGTDTFRILPIISGAPGASANVVASPGSSAATGVITIHNKKTGQIYVELRLDIRQQAIERTLREVQALLADIEGIEYKLVNGRIILDGFVLLPKDLKRIGNVIFQFGAGDGQSPISSLVTLSPLAKKKIVEYINRDINNPEVQATSVGDYIKLEGIVNSAAEKKRVSDVALLYLPDIVTEKIQSLTNINFAEKNPGQGRPASDYIIDLVQIRKEEDKEAPPPKMIQIVMHVVEYSERYLKGFNFTFSPSLSGLGAAQAQRQPNAPGSISEIAAIVDNLLPKLNWAKNHGFIRLLDTASLLVQDKTSGAIDRGISVQNGTTTAAGAAAGQPATTPGGAGPDNTQQYNLNLTVNRAEVKTQRSELVELNLRVTTNNAGTLSIKPVTTVNTTVSIRSRQSAALAGIITKKSENQFGGPTGAGAIFTLNHGKNYIKSSSNYVLFVTPIVKSSASAGVEQIKKKFRLKD